MKKLIFSGVVCLLAFAVLSNVSAFAYLVNGNLDDWGVTPGSDWDPNAGVYNIVDDWNGTPSNGYLDPGYGGQACDVEAIYFDNDETYAYLAIVTGYGGAGRGDIGIDTNEDGFYEYALRVSDSKVYSLDIPSDWDNVTFLAHAESNPYKINDISSPKGMAEFIYSDAYTDVNGVNHYILEAKIALDWLGLDAGWGNPITPILIHWTMSCGNDSLLLKADVNPVPEPASLLLVAMGLLGLGGRRYKKIRKLG